MYIQELYQLTMWMNKEVTLKGIPQKYQQLFAKLSNNVQPNRAKAPFETEKNNLIEALKDMRLEVLNDEQRDFLIKLNILDIFGEEAIHILEDILYKNSLDIATSSSQVNAITTRLNQGVEKLKQIQGGLSGLVTVEENITDKIIIKLHFDNKASIKNITDFKKWSIIWYDISRGITMVHGVAPEEIEVVGANKGSIIIELATAYGITKTISEIILKILQVIEKVFDIRKKAEELKAMKLSNEKIALDLEKEANHIKKVEIEEIVKEVLSTNNITDGDISNNLTKSVTKLLDFIDKGGEVDFTMPDDEKEESQEEDTAIIEMKDLLKNKFQEIRLIENKLKQIQYTSKDS